MSYITVNCSYFLSVIPRKKLAVWWPISISKKNNLLPFVVIVKFGAILIAIFFCFYYVHTILIFPCTSMTMTALSCSNTMTFPTSMVINKFVIWSWSFCSGRIFSNYVTSNLIRLTPMSFCWLYKYVIGCLEKRKPCWCN